ncbi:MAG: glutamate racemase [Firmicutes bacterium]|nr:glutamate racemase [Bacillota bacterium]
MRLPEGGIGFFDSGLGGLTVLDACAKRLQGIPIYYYGDNSRAPYGNLSAEKIRDYAAEAFDVFASLKVRAAVIACNTVTAVCADAFRKKYSFPIVGAEPAVMPAARRGGEVFVLATRATVESERFKRLCRRAERECPRVSLRSFACDRLAGAIEERLFDAGAKRPFDFSPFFPPGNPDSVVLGCTHYVFLKKQAENFYHCPVYDGNEGIARELTAVLKEKSSPQGELRPLGSAFLCLSPLSTTDRIFLPFGGERTAAFPLHTPDGKESEAALYPFGGGEELFAEDLVESRDKNIRSCCFSEKGQKCPEKHGFFPVFFLGSGKMVNKIAYEQMFAV